MTDPVLEVLVSIRGLLTGLVIVVSITCGVYLGKFLVER